MLFLSYSLSSIFKHHISYQCIKVDLLKMLYLRVLRLKYKLINLYHSTGAINYYYVASRVLNILLYR